MGQVKRLGAAVFVAAIAAVMQGISPAQAISYAPSKSELGVAPTLRQEIVTEELQADGSFTSSEVAPGRFEVIFSGNRFKSRELVERYLLYRAALLAKQSGASWFGLLYLPGEAGPDTHPAYPGSIQPSYGHWQPHWNYYVSGLGWQPWHPEWATAFWADSIDLALVERYNAHAMIELGVGSRPQSDQPIFAADEVIRRLEPTFL